MHFLKYYLKPTQICKTVCGIMCSTAIILGSGNYRQLLKYAVICQNNVRNWSNLQGRSRNYKYKAIS